MRRAKPLFKFHLRAAGFVMFTAGALLASATVGAAQYALLAGVSRYAETTPLDGPVPDVEALHATLTQQYGFPGDKDKTRVLLDGAATRQAVLDGLNALYAQSRAGDLVLFYFSGHGLSRVAPGAPKLPYGSGAVVPYDARFKGSADDLYASLIVGRRDLNGTQAQPGILRKLDQGGRKVLVIFDTCYSGEAVRSWRPAGAPPAAGAVSASRRPPVLPAAWSSTMAPGGAEDPPDAYPYQNVYFMAASQAGETAFDINRNELAGHPTIDNQYHGAFTDALLRVLREPGAGRLPAPELFVRVKDIMHQRFPQTPRALPDAGEPAWAQMHRIVLAEQGEAAAQTATATSTPDVPAGGVLRVALDDAPTAVEAALAPLFQPGTAFERVTANAAVRVQRQGTELTVLRASGDRVWSGPAAGADTPATLERVLRREQWLARLLALPRQAGPLTVNVRIGKDGQARDGGSFSQGDTLELIATASAPAHLLFLSVNPVGAVYLLKSALAQKATHVRQTVQVDCDPCGSEFVVAAAFDVLPPALAKLRGGEFKLDSPEFALLTEQLSAASARGSLDSLVLVSRQ